MAVVLAISEQQLIKAFLDQLWLDKGVSEHTLSAYGTDLSKFALFLQQQGQQLGVSQCARAECQQFFPWPHGGRQVLHRVFPFFAGDCRQRRSTRPSS